MKRTVYYIQGKDVLHRSAKCAESTDKYGDFKLESIEIPEDCFDVANYCRDYLGHGITRHICLRCWHCLGNKI